MRLGADVTFSRQAAHSPAPPAWQDDFRSRAGERATPGAHACGFVAFGTSGATFLHQAHSQARPPRAEAMHRTQRWYAAATAGRSSRGSDGTARAASDN